MTEIKLPNTKIPELFIITLTVGLPSLADLLPTQKNRAKGVGSTRIQPSLGNRACNDYLPDLITKSFYMQRN